MTTVSFDIQTKAYSGPMELLVELIGKRKVFVNDISLADIADEFIASIQDMDEFPVDKSSSFILTASTLILIKSKSLLPQLNLTDEEHADIHDLERRLELYTLYTDVAEHIRARYGVRVCLPALATPVLPDPPPSAPPENVTPSSCRAALQRVIDRTPTTADIPQATVQKVIRLEDMVERLIERVRTSMKMSFREFAHASHTPEHKQHVIVSFLALLELARQGMIRVQQSQQFHDIELETDTITTPDYR